MGAAAQSGGGCGAQLLDAQYSLLSRFAKSGGAEFVFPVRPRDWRPAAFAGIEIRLIDVPTTVSSKCWLGIRRGIAGSACFLCLLLPRSTGPENLGDRARGRTRRSLACLRERICRAIRRCYWPHSLGRSRLCRTPSVAVQAVRDLFGRGRMVRFIAECAFRVGYG